MVYDKKKLHCFYVVFECAKKKQVVDMGAELMKLTNNITCMMMMSMRCSDESDEAVRIRELVKEAFEILEKVWIGDMLGPLVKPSQARALYQAKT